MIRPERFHLVPKLKDVQQNTLAAVIRMRGDETTDRTLAEVCGIALTVREARALRDWLDSALGEERAHG